MSPMRIFAALLLLAGACMGPAGPPGPPGGNGSDGASGSPAEDFESGQRIKARATTTVTTTADGAMRTVRSFVGWFDSMRNELCSPMLASDGKTRCIPTTVALVDTNANFADAACTIPVAVAIAGCGTPAPRYVAVHPAVTCPQTVGARIFAAGLPVTSYYSKSGANCFGPSSIPSFTFYPTSGAEIPASSFVEMDITATTE